MNKTSALENLFAYSVSNYADTEVGAIRGSRTDTEVDAVPAKNKTGKTLGNGDVACFNFKDNRQKSMLWLRKYVYNTTSPISSPIVEAQGDWTQPVVNAAWGAVLNGHAVASSGEWLFATGYDRGKIAVIDMDDSYNQVISYDFPENLAETGVVYHGEGLATSGDKLLVLMTGNQGGGYDNYVDSYVLLYQINSDGSLSYLDSARVGMNAFELYPCNGKYYVPCVGGKQQEGHANAESGIWAVTVTVDEKGKSKLVSKQIVVPTGMEGDFRDIAIVNREAYVFAAHYSDQYATQQGHIYKTTLDNLEAEEPDAWTIIQDIDEEGYFWAIHAEENGRFWFVRGQRIQVYYNAGSISADTTPDRNFTTNDLAENPNYKQINAACFLLPDVIATRALGATAVSHAAKSLAGQARLAREAFLLAKKSREEI